MLVLSKKVKRFYHNPRLLQNPPTIVEVPEVFWEEVGLTVRRPLSYTYRMVVCRLKLRHTNFFLRKKEPLCQRGFTANLPSVSVEAQTRSCGGLWRCLL